MKKLTKADKVKAVVALTVIGVSLIYGLSALWTFRRGLPPDRRPMPLQSSSGAQEGTLPSPAGKPGVLSVPLKPFPQEDLKESIMQLRKDLQLSPEQMVQLGKIWVGSAPRSPEELKERLDRTRERLSPVQREVLQTFLDHRVPQRILERREVARRALPPDQFKIYEQGLVKVEDYFLGLLSDEVLAQDEPEQAR